MDYKAKEVIGNCTLYLANAYELAPQLGMFDNLVADPQYEFETSGGGKMRKERKCLEAIIAEGLDKGFDHKILNPLLYRSVVVFCHNDQLPELLAYLKGLFQRFCVMQWHKTNPSPFANKHYLPDTEFFIHAWSDGGHPVGKLKDKRRHITTNNGKSDFDHPTVKPLEVMEKIMRNMGGDSVLDPFMGTGTTGVAAMKYGKQFTGIEQNEKHFETACRRISQMMEAQAA